MKTQYGEGSDQGGPWMGRQLVWAVGTAFMAVCGCSGADASSPDAAHVPDSGFIDDGNDSFVEAAALAIGPEGVSGVIQQPGDHDFYVFEARAGDWLQILALPDSASGVFPVVTLYDAGHTQLAVGIEILETHIFAAGTHYLEVQDYTTYSQAEPAGGSEFTYTLTVTTFVDGEGLTVIDTEAGDDAASARSIGPPMVTGRILGTFRDVTDVDVFSLTTPFGTQVFSVLPLRGDVDGNGSTADAFTLRVTDATGATTISRITSVSGVSSAPLLAPLTGNTTYLLWIEHGSVMSGANDFHASLVDIGILDSPYEKEPQGTSGANDTIDAATTSGEILDLTGPDLEADFLVWIGDGDVDYVGFDVGGQVIISPACESRPQGSGVLGLRTSVRHSNDVAIMQATEGVSTLSDITLPAAGRYWFRLDKSGQDPEVAGTYARCRITVVPT